MLEIPSVEMGLRTNHTHQREISGADPSQREADSKTRLLLVRRVFDEHWPVARAARAAGVREDDSLVGDPAYMLFRCERVVSEAKRREAMQES